MGKKIYVGNLNYRTTSAGLQALFARYGEVAGVSLVTDRQTGEPRGFAFVEMASADAATQAITDLDGKEFEGRKLRVNEAVNKPRPPRE
jgi:RNA recognition motif-containing protein